MEPILDEASLVSCPKMPPAQRIGVLAKTLKALDGLGARRFLRSTRDAAHRELLNSLGLLHWCFDRQTDRDAGRFVAQRLGKASFIDGADGLFTSADGKKIIQSTIHDVCSIGGGHVALTDGLLVLLRGTTWPKKKPIHVRLNILSDDDERTEEVPVDSVDCVQEVDALADSITRKINQAITNGVVLLARLPELCSCVVLGEKAEQQVKRLTGTEPFFRQVIRHLRVLDHAARIWKPGTPFSPDGVTFSPESEATLKNGIFGPMRDFPSPPGFDVGRWTLHTKLTGGNGARLYFKTQEFEEVKPGASSIRCLRIAVGYIGPHLQTVRFP